MEYVKIKQLWVSVICLGTAYYGSKFSRKESFRLLDTYVENGGNFLDTALIYADWVSDKKSRSEKIIGEWMQERGNRDEIIISTKGGHPHLFSMDTPRLSRKDIIQDLNKSLEHLKTDYVDLYWLHRDDPKIPVEYILDTLRELKKKGKIRFYGCSNWKVERIQEAMEYAEKYRIDKFIANQMMWSLAIPRNNMIEDSLLEIMNKETYEFHKKNNFVAIPYSPQAKGFFNKMQNGRYDCLNKITEELYYSKPNIGRYERARKLANDFSVSISQIILGYLLSQPFVTIPVVGCRTVEQLKDSIYASDIKLSAKVLDYLEGSNKIY